MQIKFSKYHGLGNDFIITEYNEETSYSRLALDICNRKTGIGADGLIIVKREPLSMLFYNQDGSIGSMCANGLRCFAKYLKDNDNDHPNKFNVKTLGGDYEVQIIKDLIKLEFNNISFASSLMDINTNKSEFFKEVLLDTICYAVFTGTAHLVVFVKELDKIDEEFAKALHQDSIFKNKINVNFVKIINEKLIKIKTYERGVGFTLACGTGAVASFIISNRLNKVSNVVEVYYPLGSLYIEKHLNNVFLTGPAKKIAEGFYNI